MRPGRVHGQALAGPNHLPARVGTGKWLHLSTISGQAGRLTPFSTGRDNRSTSIGQPKIPPLRISPRAVVVPRPAGRPAGLGVSGRWIDCGLGSRTHVANLKNGVPLYVGEAMKVRLRSVNRETCREVWLPAWRVDDLVVQIRCRRDRGCSWLAISKMTGLSVDTCHGLYA